ncbi:MAG: molybdopterin-binding protein, partial [Sphingobacteriales bacterium]
SLRAALHSMGITSVFIHVVPDDLQQLEKCINEAMKLSDMLLITGGVSVGDHDHTLDALLQSGFKIIFHGVRQKPGKPLLFGMKGSKPVFGLPGNPSSVLTCFYQYV